MSEGKVEQQIEGNGDELPAEGDSSDSGDQEEIALQPKKSRKILVIAGIAALVIAIAGGGYWLYSRQFESTDDAFIEGDVVQVSPKVSAYVAKVYVTNNQFVHKGDLLVELTPADFAAKLEAAKANLQTALSQKDLAQANTDLTELTTSASQIQARSNVKASQNNVKQSSLAAASKQSQIAQAQAAVKTARANLAQVKAQIPQGESALNLARIELNRRQTLFNNGDIPKASLDQADNSYQAAKSQLDALERQVQAAQSRVDEAIANVGTATDVYNQSLAQVDLTRAQVGESQGRLEDANAAPERLTVSRSQVGTADATIQAAEAAVHQAELDLSYTRIYAPEDGYVAKKNVNEGQFVQPGSPLMAISQSTEVWVVANFKETQLENMHEGQTVDVEVDAFPRESFHAHVQSFQAGTGSRFSVLPAENATGNFVKVVQRVPVKIVFDEPREKISKLVPGMSVEPSVKVR